MSLDLSPRRKRPAKVVAKVQASNQNGTHKMVQEAPGMGVRKRVKMGSSSICLDENP